MSTDKSLLNFDEHLQAIEEGASKLAALNKWRIPFRHRLSTAVRIAGRALFAEIERLRAENATLKVDLTRCSICRQPMAPGQVHTNCGDNAHFGSAASMWRPQ